MAGYSGTPLPKKLGIKPGHRVLVLGAPEGFALDAEDVSLRTTARGPADVIVSFHDRRAELARRMPKLRSLMEPAAGLWIAWPKRSSGVPTHERLGHAIQSPAAGSISERSFGIRRASSARRWWKDTITSAGPRAVVRRLTSSTSSANPSGAPSTSTRCPGLMPSFFGSGVPEYPATA